MSDSYYIAKGITAAELELRVEALCEKGFRPCGGPLFVPYVASVTGGGNWYQAMSKFNDIIGSTYSSSAVNFPDVLPLNPPKPKPEG